MGKKRYAGLRIHHSTNNAIHTVIKGLEMIKRDQCLMVKNIGNHILNEILKVRTLNNTGQNRDSVVQNIKNIVSKVSNNFESYDFNQFIISKVKFFYFIILMSLADWHILKAHYHMQKAHWYT